MDPASSGLFDILDEPLRLASDYRWYTRTEFMQHYGVQRGLDKWAEKELRVASDGMVYDRDSFRTFYGFYFTDRWEEARIRTLEVVADHFYPSISEDEEDSAASASGEDDAEAFFERIVLFNYSQTIAR